MGVGGRDGCGVFFTDISIGLEVVVVVIGTTLADGLMAFILVLCLAVSLALSSAATVDLAGVTALFLLLARCAPNNDEAEAVDGEGTDDGLWMDVWGERCVDGGGEDAMAVVADEDIGESGGVGLVEFKRCLSLQADLVVDGFRSVESGLVRMSCFFHLVRRF